MLTLDDKIEYAMHLALTSAETVNTWTNGVACIVIKCAYSTALVLGHAEQREFEANLKKQKREFGETLERYEAEVDKYAQRSELSKRDELAAQVSELSQKLKEVSQLSPSTAYHRPSVRHASLCAAQFGLTSTKKCAGASTWLLNTGSMVTQ